MAYKARPVAERFWEKVDKSGDCWIWTAAKQPAGYGKFVVKKGDSPSTAHRLSYEMEVGPIPDGLQVLHHCDNPPCVRPDHLFVGTQKDARTSFMHKLMRLGMPVTHRVSFGEDIDAACGQLAVNDAAGDVVTQGKSAIRANRVKKPASKEALEVRAGQR